MARRRSERVWWLSVLTITSTLLWSAIVLAQESIGQVTALQGQAMVQRAGSSQTLPLRVQSPVYREDKIQTLAASKIKLFLIDGTELVLGEGGVMTLSHFVFAPPPHTPRGVVSIAQGILRAVTRKLLPQTTFEVRTATAVAAVRGTQWLQEVTPDTTAIVVLEGEVSVAHADAQVHGRVMLTPGLGTDVKGKASPTAPRQWPEQRVSKLQQATELP